MVRIRLSLFFNDDDFLSSYAIIDLLNNQRSTSIHQ